jgi:heptosyltransferase I
LRIIDAVCKPLKILIVRLSALGDATHVVPVVRALQQARPDAEISWLIGKLEHRLVGDLPGVNFVVLDKRNPRPALTALRAAEPYDALLLMQLSFRAGWLTRSVRANRRIGFDFARSKELHSLFIKERIASDAGPHVLDALMGFLTPLGVAPPTQPDWRLPVPATAQAFVEANLPGPQRTLLLSAASSHALRNWSVERYARVADYAQQQHGLRVALVGSPSAFERALGDAIKSHMRTTPVDLIGRDTLKELLATMQHAVGVLTPDSGPAHMARALGVPVLGLYAATDPHRSGAYRALNFSVNRYPEAARQFLGREPAELRWGQKIERPGVMDLIETDAVIERLDALLQAR